VQHIDLGSGEQSSTVHLPQNANGRDVLAQNTGGAFSRSVREWGTPMTELQHIRFYPVVHSPLVYKFDPAIFLASAGPGRTIVRLRANQNFFSQGHPAATVFYLQIGRAKLTVVSKGGKEATIALLAAGEFVGEEAIVSIAGLRMATATATSI
jgi:hypothetical protein